MKKILVLAATFLLVSTSAFAAANQAIDFSNTGTLGKSLHGATSGASATTALIGKCSTGVGVAWWLDGTNGAGYALMTQHVSGTKAYGTSYDSTAIYITVNDVAPGTEAFNSGALTATDTTDFNSSTWKKM